MASQEDILNAVDGLADTLDLDFIEDEAKRLDLSVKDLLNRVVVEALARLEG